MTARPILGFLAVMMLCFIGCSNPEPQKETSEPVETITEAEAETPKDFYGKLSAYCGKTYPGKMIHDDTNSGFYNGKPLTISLDYCNENEISIPYQVGEDGSITWKLNKTESGINLSHQVIQNGKEQKISQFGGTASPNPSQPNTLAFPADEKTKKMIPVAANNTWLMRLNEEKGTLTYVIMRGESRYFEAEFNMNNPSEI